jgi:hypothetical protein
MLNKSLWLAWVIGTCFAAASGCGKKSTTAPPGEADQSQLNELKHLWLGYQQYCNEEQSPPGSADDLKRILGSSVDFTRLVVIWGVNVHNVPDADKVVLAYDVDTPKGGGRVLFVNGDITAHVAPAEFGKLVKATPLAKTIDRPADFSLSVADFIAEHKKDRFAAEKFKFKTVELRGVVSGFYKDRLFLQQSLGGQDVVSCRMEKPEPWARVAKGQSVTVKGRGPELGVALEPALMEVAIITAGPNAAIVMSTEDLARELEKEPKGLEDKYRGKAFILTGEIAEQGKGSKAVMKGTAKTQVECDFEEQNAAAKLVAGQKIKFYGEFASGDGAKVVLKECRLIR